MIRPVDQKPQGTKPEAKPGLWLTIKESASEWMEDNCMRLAASLSMYTVLALAPLLVIAIKVFAVVMGPERATRMVEGQVAHLVGSSGAPAIHQMVLHATQPSTGIWAAAISFVILIFSASSAFVELKSALDVVWDVKLRPDLSWWETIKGRLMPMALVFGIAILLLVSVIISTGITSFANSLTGGAAWITYLVDIIVSLVVLGVLFALLFKYLPDVKVAWRDALLGGGISGALFLLGQYLLSIYFAYGTPTSAYGAVGSLVAVLLWVYYSAQILFFGAEFTQVNARLQGRPAQPTEVAVKIEEAPPTSSERLRELERPQEKSGPPNP